MGLGHKVANVVIPVTDLEVAKAIYTPLFGQPHTDTPYYVGYNVAGFEIGLNPRGDVALGPVAHTAVDDVDVAKAALVAAGGSARSGPIEVAPGVRIAIIDDRDGNPIGLIGA